MKLQTKLQKVERLRDAYESLLNGFEDKEEEIDPELEALLDKHAPLEEEK